MKLIMAALILSACLSGGCSVGHRAVQEQTGLSTGMAAYDIKVERLRQALVSLGSDVDAGEAALIAETAVSYSLALAEEYRLVRPPVFHNLLINIGLKKRGLCIHWTEDLLIRLRSLGMKSFELHWGIAEPQSLFGLQHSSVIVTAQGTDFYEGIVLDAWRNSGDLLWIRVKDDRYVWQPGIPVSE